MIEGTTNCFTCGALCAVAGSEAQKQEGVLVMGILRGEPTCDICIGNDMLAGFEQGMSDVVYISQDGRSFQTWGGGAKLGTVQEMGGKGGIWSAQAISRIMNRLPVRVVHWSGVTNDGVLVYGKTMGPCMAATAHVRRKKGRIVVEAGSRIALEGVS
jgi:hypothetical protein